MSETGRKTTVGIVLLLAAGALIGFWYGEAERGLLLASLLVLLWLLLNLIRFEHALRTGDFTKFRDGEGIWQQLFSRYDYLRQRGNRYKSSQRMLIKEIRKSTSAMPDGAVIIDDNYEIVTSNKAARRLVGLKSKKDRGHRVDNIIRHPNLSKLLLADDANETVDIESPVNDNEWLSCRIVPYGAGQRLLVIRDVTERVRIGKIRRDFVANASHELRSPLTVIRGYLDSLVDDESIPEELQQPIRQMQRQARRMTSIVDELMQLSRLESSGTADQDDRVDIAALMSETSKAYSGLNDSPEIEVRVESSARLLGVESEIHSVLANLLSNAVRHCGPNGHVGVIWRTDSDGGEILVSDDGEGIAAEHIPRLTERFFRVDRGRARADGGIGLGLAIVKHVLQRHDAELHVASVPGQGSEFRCRFPASRLSVT